MLVGALSSYEWLSETMVGDAAVRDRGKRSYMLLFETIHENLFPPNQHTILLGVSGFSALNIYLMVLLIGIKPILLQNDFNNN